MKYKDWLNDWLELYVKPSVKKRTYERYSELARTIISTLGEYELNDLTPLILQKAITRMLTSGNRKTGGGFAASTVNSVISVIQSSLKTAHNLGFMDNYMADKIKRPKPEEKRMECFTIAEQKRIEQAVLSDKRQKMFGIVLCLYTGLRIGELLALEWTDVDFDKNMLYVNKSCHYGKGENGSYIRFTETPKTGSSIREIPLPKQIISRLKKLRKESSSKYVISDNGKAVTVRSYQRSFELLLKKLDIPHRGFHALRHTFATRAVECGVDIKTLSEILGHKNPTITLNRYAHSLLEHKREVMNKLGKMLD